MGIPVASIQRSALVQAWGAAGALIAGYVDSYSLLNFGVYASFMSGNTTSAGLRLGQINVAAAAHSLLPIPFFVLGTFMGTLILPADRRAGLARLSVLVAALLIMDIVAAYFAWSTWVGILLLSSAMGIMNTSITHVGAQSVSLGFVTGDLNNLGQRLASGAKRAPVRNMQGLGHSLDAGRPVGRHMGRLLHRSCSRSSIGDSIGQLDLDAPCFHVGNLRSAGQQTHCLNADDRSIRWTLRQLARLITSLALVDAPVFNYFLELFA